jgi:phospholipase C
MQSPDGANVWNTALLIGWDEPGGTYDHVPPGPVPPPDPAAPAGPLGFLFDRSGYRVPAVIVSPWVEQGLVITDEYRHTSMIATLREVWGLGAPFTGRDAVARTFQHVLNLEVPRHPDTWPAPTAPKVPDFQAERVEAGEALCTLGKHLCHGLLHHARQLAMTVPPAPTDPDAEVSPELALDIVHWIGKRLFPALSHPPSPTGAD